MGLQIRFTDAAGEQTGLIEVKRRAEKVTMLISRENGAIGIDLTREQSLMLGEILIKAGQL